MKPAYDPYDFNICLRLWIPVLRNKSWTAQPMRPGPPAHGRAGPGRPLTGGLGRAWKFRPLCENVKRSSLHCLLCFCETQGHAITKSPMRRWKPVNRYKTAAPKNCGLHLHPSFMKISRVMRIVAIYSLAQIIVCMGDFCSGITFWMLYIPNFPVGNESVSGQGFLSNLQDDTVGFL